jgi:hypothetical protein
VDDAGQFTGTIASPRPGLSHIQSGGFDPATRTLSFSYVTVGGYAANAVLRLSDDNSALTGRWAWGVGTLHGVWRLSRTR